MPFDPNSPRNPLPPLNDGYPDDWHVPPSAQGDSFPDDWHVPPSAQDDSFPDDWHIPPSAQGDGFPDDWFVPESASVPSASQPAPIAQPNIGNPGFAPRTAPSNPFAAAWSNIPADPQRAAASATPTLAEMVANLTAPLFNPQPGMLFDGASPTPTSSDVPASYRPALRLFARDSIPYPAGGSFDGGLQNNLSYGSSQSPDQGQLRSNEASDVVSNTSPEDSDPNAVLVDDTGEAERERDEQRRARDIIHFNERAFGNTPPIRSGAPVLVPPFGNLGPRPAAPAQSSSTQASSSPRASPPAGQAQPTLPGIPPPSGTRGGQQPGPAKGGAVGGGASSAVGTSVTPSDFNWRQLVQNIERIRDARAEGGAKLSSAISAALPKYDGKTTYGILITNEGDVVPLQSGPADPRYSDYTPAKHVEGKAAIWIQEHGSSGGVVYHNNTDGTCGFCHSEAETLLPKGANFRIVPPSDAVPKNSRARAVPTDYVGNANVPKPPRQGHFFARQP